MSTAETELRVVLVRHAQTEWSRDGRHTGLTDIPLTDAGREVAATLRERLAAWRFARVFASPLLRARETCELAGLADAAQPLAELVEWDYGDYEGLTTPEIRRERPDWNLWRDGCPGGEDAAAVGARVDRAIARLREGADGDVAVFSHGHTLRVLGARWIEMQPRGGGRLGLQTAALSLLAHEHGIPILSRWNDTAAGSFSR